MLVRTEDQKAHRSKWKVGEKVWEVAEEFKNSSIDEDCQQVQVAPLAKWGRMVVEERGMLQMALIIYFRSDRDRKCSLELHSGPNCYTTIAFVYWFC